MSEALFTEAEAAARLNIRPDRLRHLRYRGEIGYVRVGKSARYTNELLASYITTQTVERSAP